MWDKPKIDSDNFSVRGYLPLIWKNSTTHMHGLTVDGKEGLSYAPDSSLENSADSYLYFLSKNKDSCWQYCTLYDQKGQSKHSKMVW